MDCSVGTATLSGNDARFISNAPTDIAYLIERVRKLELKLEIAMTALREVDAAEISYDGTDYKILAMRALAKIEALGK